MTYLESPEYLMDPIAYASYTYDEAGNRIGYVSDIEEKSYNYDEANRMLSDGYSDYTYDANGNLIAATTGEGTVYYSYTANNKLEEITYPDGTYVKYGYDAFGRKVYRQEGYWHLENGGNGSGGNSDNSNNGNNGKSELAPGQNGNANKGNSANAPGQLKKQENAAKENPLKMKTEETRYLYEGFSTSLMKEYTPEGSPLMQYYTANNSVVASKMFGLHGRNLPGREPTLKTTGGMMYYHYDGMRNVTELTDRHGSTIEEYRYDVFGGLFTGITAPFNTKGIAGHEYDPKAGLVNMHARWYTPEAGRFITQDPYRGDLLTPYTQNRYAYVGNNPVNRWDPLGYSGEPYDSDDEYEMGGWIWPLKSLIRDIDEYTYEYDTWKGSDGWYTDWYLSIIKIKEYRIDWYLAKETNSGWVDEYLSTTYETESYEYYSSGSNFEPFTPQEWYQENSGVLNSYGQLPEGTPVRESAKISISYDNLKNNLIQQTVENKLDKTIVQMIAPQETLVLASANRPSNTNHERAQARKNLTVGIFEDKTVIGTGIQMQISGVRGVGGIEFIWFDEITMKERNEDYANHDFSVPIVYMYGGGEIDGSLAKSILTDKKPGVSFSFTAFAVFATDEFTKFEHYEGVFKTTSVQLFHINTSVASDLENKTITTGIGASTTKFGASAGATYYKRVESGEEILKFVQENIEMGTVNGLDEIAKEYGTK